MSALIIAQTFRGLKHPWTKNHTVHFRPFDEHEINNLVSCLGLLNPCHVRAVPSEEGGAGPDFLLFLDFICIYKTKRHEGQNKDKDT